MARPRLTPEEREARRQERNRRGFAGDTFRSYDDTDEIGRGNSDQWRGAAGHAAGGFTMEPPQTVKVKVDADLARLNLTEMPKTMALLIHAYRMASRTAHPDTPTGSDAAFVALGQSYERLKLTIRGKK